MGLMVDEYKVVFFLLSGFYTNAGKQYSMVYGLTTSDIVPL